MMDEVFRLQEGPTDPECDFFRAIAKQGYAQGRPRTSQQGIYCFAPSGEFLGSDNTRDPRRAERVIRSSLEKWKDLPRAKRLRTDDPSKTKIARNEDSYPKDGLVLRQYARDLPRRNEEDGVWMDALNFDMVWFRADEVKGWTQPEVPAAVVRRLVRYHMVDNVRGQNFPFQDGQIEKATITGEVVSRKGSQVTYRYAGEAAASDANRGMEVRILGRATWDQGRFTSFEVVVVGERWGRSNARREDSGRRGVGYVYQLAGDRTVDRVAPAYFGAYGWR